MFHSARIRRTETLFAISVIAIVLPAVPASAAANKTSAAIVCLPNTVTAPASSFCTVTLTNSESSAGAPQGTVAITQSPVAANAAITGATCTLGAGLSTVNACTQRFVFLRSGTQTMTATFTPSTSGTKVSDTDTVTVKSSESGGAIYSPNTSNGVTRSRSIDVYLAGCGASAYVGIIVSQDGDPSLTANVSSGFKAYEAKADANGGWEWHVDVPSDNGLGTFYSRYYCASSSVSSLTAKAVTWTSSLYTVSIAS